MNRPPNSLPKYPIGADGLPELPAEIPFIGKRKARQLNRAYEQARAAYRAANPLTSSATGSLK